MTDLFPATEIGTRNANSRRGLAHLKRKISLRDLHDIKSQLRTSQLHSVCEEALCPNRGECFARGVATFLIGGDTCTRACRFCSIKTGRPEPLDPMEPQRLADSAARMGLKHVVVTSVNRDDVADGGATHFSAVIHALRQALPDATVEVLTPDFLGNMSSVKVVCDAVPDVFNHNVETVPRLYKKVRPGAGYQRSLDVLQYAADLLPGTLIKTGLMVGHGETDAELESVLEDLLSHGVNALTVGQYFQPTSTQLQVSEYWDDIQFLALEERAREAGFRYVWAGRYIRSSYLADHFVNDFKAFSKTGS